MRATGGQDAVLAHLKPAERCFVSGRPNRLCASRGVGVHASSLRARHHTPAFPGSTSTHRYRQPFMTAHN
jgi:methionine salvage enolase-phosphatase E1